jgi:proteasome ATPase
MDDRLRLFEEARAHTPDPAAQVDRPMIEEMVRLQSRLNEASEMLGQMEAVLEEYAQMPWFPAVFLRWEETRYGREAVVQTGNTRRVVAVAEWVERENLVCGDEVYVGNDMTLLTARAEYGPPPCGPVAAFVRRTPDGRLVLKDHEEELVVEAAEALRTMALREDDPIRFDRVAAMAYERMERMPGNRFLLEEVPAYAPNQLGGQEANLRKLVNALAVTLLNPAMARRYRLEGRHSILLVGPPGCGKTLMARIATSQIARISKKRARFGVVKPGEFESMWVGQTERAIRECFESLRKAAQDGLAVLFLDEIEAIARIRGGASGHHSDRFLAALLAEIDGFAGREGVAIVAATNRKDLVDQAMLDRLSATEILVDRPDPRGAEAIFDIHLDETIPYYPNGAKRRDTRQEVISQAVSRLYSPNADNQLCTLRFRDGKQRAVTARELLSGRVIEQVCRSARQAAFYRELEGGGAGVRVEDMEEAVADVLERLSTTLTRHNVYAYLSDLPQDVDVIAVDPVVRRVSRPHRFLRSAS